MFVFLDIGFTLIGGPSVGPARRLLEALQLPPAAKAPLTRLLFCTPTTQPELLAAAMVQQWHTDPIKTFATVQQLWQAQIEEAYVLPGAEEWLEKLRHARIPYGFISNIWAPFHAGFCRLFPQESRSRPSFLSFQQQCAKPDLNIYQTALAQVGTPASQTIMIGDTYQMDIAPPRQLGIKTVWVLHRPQQELADTVQTLNGLSPPPDRTVAHLGQLEVEHLYSLLKEKVDHARPTRAPYHPD
ncbi:MAG: HAD family hydrolase [Magnetococcales bacterium]|nr:HAD family hydrolase [Magnetococcales bacterium]